MLTAVEHIHVRKHNSWFVEICKIEDARVDENFLLEI